MDDGWIGVVDILEVVVGPVANCHEDASEKAQTEVDGDVCAPLAAGGADMRGDASRWTMQLTEVEAHVDADGAHGN